MSLSRIANSIYDGALSLLYPQQCVLCGGAVDLRDDGVSCSDCWEQTRIFDGSETACWKCGVEATALARIDNQHQVRCRRCDDFEFTSARACGVYEGALRAAVLALKIESHIAPRLARLLWNTQQRPPLNGATRIVPVPLHRARQSERGFNQAATIGFALSELSGLTFDEWSLIRPAATERHRAGMDARSRRESVAGAFEITRPRLIKGEKILLIDDVLTSGATASACASALKLVGALDVFVLTIARPER